MYPQDKFMPCNDDETYSDLYLGDKNVAADKAELEAHGITRILNLCSEDVGTPRIRRTLS